MKARDQLLHSFDKYFPREVSYYFNELPIPSSSNGTFSEISRIELPNWARDLGVESPAYLLVPSCCVCGHVDPVWENVDWWRAAFLLMTCSAERSEESKGGPIHSYSYKLPGSMRELWERAWVNRIFLFLRRWVSHRNSVSESELFGKAPRATIHLTHDVDYVSKTLALRLKQMAFTKYNILKSLLSGNVASVLKLFPRLFRFGLAPGDYWQFPVICALESEFGVSSSWNFYGGVGGFGRSASELLLDPAYRVADQKISRQLKQLLDEGNRIGLHQGFHSWQSPERMEIEKKRLEQALGTTIDSCRQHWLKFSFIDTWKAQETAGFRLDSTLGFNDRSGFRNSAALRMPAWIHGDNRFSDSLEILPMVLMDSHLFDYVQMETDARKQVIDYYLDEIAFVGGEATVIWHHRVFHPDYGWGDDYRYLLEGIRLRELQT
jgi:hypothetical protein